MKAVIFDMDGTLLDSMPTWRELGPTFLKEAGIPTTPEQEKLLRTLGAPTEWLVYPEFEEQNARLREISHLAATFSDEQQEFLLVIFIVMGKKNY